MEKVRNRNILVITFSALAFLLFFSAASSTACAEVKKGRRKRVIANNTLDVYSLIRRPTEKELAGRGFSAEKYMAKEQTVTDKDVFYLVVFCSKTSISLLDEDGNTHYIDSSNFLRILTDQKEKKKLIWVIFIGDNYFDIHSTMNAPKVEKYLQEVCTGGNVVLELIEPEQYDLLTKAEYTIAGYIIRLRKLATIWWHVLFDKVEGANIILYNPLSESTSYALTPNTVIACLINVFMNNCASFDRAFVIMGFLNKGSQEKDAALQKQEEEIVKSIRTYPQQLYIHIKEYLNTAPSTSSTENDLYPCIRIKKTYPYDYLIPKKKSLTHRKSPLEKGVYMHTLRCMNTPLDHISFIFSGLQVSSAKLLPFETFLTMSSTQSIQIYVNLLKQNIAYNKYSICGYTPLYLDFSFCVLASLNSGCFEELFSKTEYLLIRDVDCKCLRLFLQKRPSKILSHFFEVPRSTEELAQLAADYKDLLVKDKKLQEMCPRIILPDMVYHITEHMVFMQSTLQIDLSSEHERYVCFDVLISREAITDKIHIGEKEKRIISDKEEGKKEESMKKDISLCQSFFSSKHKALNEESRRKKSRIALLEFRYSSIQRQELASIIEKERENPCPEEKKRKLSSNDEIDSREIPIYKGGPGPSSSCDFSALEPSQPIVIPSTLSSTASSSFLQPSYPPISPLSDNSEMNFMNCLFSDISQPQMEATPIEPTSTEAGSEESASTDYTLTELISAIPMPEESITTDTLYENLVREERCQEIVDWLLDDFDQPT